MKNLQNKKQPLLVRLKTALNNAGKKSNFWLWAVPLMIISLAGTLWLLIHSSQVFASVLYEILLKIPHIAQQNINLPLILAVSLLALVVYFYIDYQQHLLPFKQESIPVQYRPLHHAKVVVLPRMKYNWLRGSCSILYGVVFMFLFTLVVVPVFADSIPIITTKTASNITTDSAVLAGTVTPKGVEERGFEYGLTDDYGSTAEDESSLNYTYDSQWGSSGSGNGRLDAPHRMALDSQDNIYVLDGNNLRVQKFDSSGTYLLQWPISGSGIAVDSQDNVYISITDSNRIQKFDSSGNLVTQWGTLGTGNGQFDGPGPLAIDSQDNIYVSELGNDRIQKFDSSGNYLTKWGSYGSGDGQFQTSPYAITTDSQDNVYVAEQNINRVQKFTSSGTFLLQWQAPGGSEEQSVAALAADSNDFVYGFNNGNVKKFDSSGNLINQFAAPGTLGLAFDQNDELYISDIADNNIQKFTGTISKQLESLSCGTTYHYRAYATTNSFGTVYGDDETFTTEACLPTAFITTWKTDNPGSSGNNEIVIPIAINGDAEIEWEEVGNPSNNGTTNSTAITFPSPGTYRVSITGDITQIFFNNSGDVKKLLTIEQWGTSQWSTMEYAFHGASNLTIPAIDAPDLSNATSLAGMFGEATSLNSSINHWDVSAVTNMAGMFNGATSFNQPLNSWDTGNVTNMSNMFSGASSFNQPLNSWDTGNVTNMAGMFNDTTSFNQPLNSWDTSNVTDMSAMFIGASNFDQSLAGWDMTGITVFGAYDMFGNSGGPSDIKLSTANYDATLIAWSQQNLKNGVSFGAGRSEYCDSIEERQSIIDTFSWTINDGGETADCVNESDAFITTWKTDTPGAVNPNEITIPADTANFSYNYTVDWGDGEVDSNVSDNIAHNYDVPGEYTIKITGQFPRLYSLLNYGIADKLLSVEQWGSIEWQSMEGMFLDSTNLVINATDTPDLTGVSSVRGMFDGATNFNSDISNWDMSNITNMEAMFEDATSFNQPLNNWDLSHVTDTSSMFRGAVTFNQPLDSWNMGSVTKTNSMFAAATNFNQTLNSWNVSNVTDMSYMFAGATSFDQSLGSWDVSGVSTMENMFLSEPISPDTAHTYQASGISTENYDSTLIGWSNQSLQPLIPFSAGLSTYCAAIEERQDIIDTYGWTITDAGEDCTQLTMLEITTTTLSSATVGEYYSEYIYTVNAYNNDADFSIVANSLPQGLALEDLGDYAHLSGTPTEEGSFDFTIRAADTNTYDEQAFTLEVETTPEPSPLPDAAGPFVTISSPRDMLNLSSGQQSVIITGTGPKNQIIDIYLDGVHKGGSVVDEGGNWHYQLTNLSAGTRQIQARWQPDEDIAFISGTNVSELGNSLKVVDTETDAVIREIDLPDQEIIISTELSPTKDSLFIVTSQIPEFNYTRILKFDFATGKLSNVSTFDDDWIILNAKIDADGSKAYLLAASELDYGNVRSLSVGVLDLETNQPVTGFSTGTIDNSELFFTSLVASQDRSKMFTLDPQVTDNGSIYSGPVLGIVDTSTDTPQFVHLFEFSGIPEDTLVLAGGMVEKDGTLYVSAVDVLRDGEDFIDAIPTMYEVDVETAEVTGRIVLSGLPTGTEAFRSRAAILDSSNNRIYLYRNCTLAWVTPGEPDVSTETICDPINGPDPSYLYMGNDSYANFGFSSTESKLYIPSFDATSYSTLVNTSVFDTETQSLLEGDHYPVVGSGLSYNFNSDFIGTIDPQTAQRSIQVSVEATTQPSSSTPTPTTKATNPNTTANETTAESQQVATNDTSTGANNLNNAPTSVVSEQISKVGALERAITTVAIRLGVSPQTLVWAFPWILIMFIGLLALVALVRALWQLYIVAKTRKLVLRQELLNHEKRSLLSLSGHYLRTPLTILSAGVEMLPQESGARREIVQASQKLQTTINTLTGSIENNQDLANLTEPTPQLKQSTKLFQKTVVMPIVISVGLILSINVLVAFYTTLNPGWINLIAQLTGVILAGVLLHSGYHLLKDRRNLAVYEAQLLEHEQTLDSVRNSFIQSVSRELVPAIVTVDSAVPPGLPEEETKYFKEGLRQLEHTVENFILIGQLEQKKLRQKASEVNINETFSRVGQEDESHHILTIKVPKTTVVNQPEFLLRKVFISLVNNASEHSDLNQPITIGSRRIGKKVSISVTDRGDGIAEEKLSSLFKPLSRVEEAEDFTHRGIGLSLYVDRLIMHYLGGEISAESQLGNGTTIHVSIPSKLATEPVLS